MFFWLFGVVLGGEPIARHLFSVPKNGTHHYTARRTRPSVDKGSTHERLNGTLLIWEPDGVHVPQRKYECSLGTCTVTTNRSLLLHKDTIGVIFYAIHVPDETDEDRLIVPPRPAHHQWVYYNDESPCTAYWLQDPNFLALFNWSVALGRNSTWPIWPTEMYGDPPSALLQDPPMPVATKTKLRNSANATQRRSPIAWVHSNCESSTGRMQYIKELTKHVGVDSYGKCLHNRDLPFKEGWYENSMGYRDYLAGYKFYIGSPNCVSA
jgi:hypothetical protein